MGIREYLFHNNGNVKCWTIKETCIRRESGRRGCRPLIDNSCGQNIGVSDKL